MARPAEGSGTTRREGIGAGLRVVVEAVVLTALWAFALSHQGEILDGGAWITAAVGASAAVLLPAAIVRAIWPRERTAAALAGVLIGAGAWSAWFASVGGPAFWFPDTGEKVRDLFLRTIEGIAPVPVASELTHVLVFVALAGAIVTMLLHSALGAAFPAGLLPALVLVIPQVITGVPAGAVTMVIAGLGLLLLVWLRAPRPNLRGLVVVGTAAALGWGAVTIAPPTRDTVWNHSVMVGPTSGLVPDVTVALAEDLRARSQAEAFAFTATEPGAVRFLLATLSTFDDGRWTPRDELTGAGMSVDQPRDASGLPPGGASAPLPEGRSVTVTMRGLVSTWLPLPQSVVQAVEVQKGLNAIEWLWLAESNTARSRLATTSGGDEYTAAAPPMVADDGVRGALEEGAYRGAGVFADVDAAPEALARYLALPAPVPESVGSVAEDVAGGLTNRLEVGYALEDFFTSGAFVYDEAAPYTPGMDGGGHYGVMESFLVERSGFCVHYASTFAIMARHLGVPTRLAVGYASRAEGEQRVAVRGGDLHAWPEIYVEGSGWLAFEPTPGGAGFRADQPEAPEPPPVAPEPEVPEVMPEEPTIDPVLPQEPEPEAPEPMVEEPEAESLGWLVPWVLGALGLVLLLCLPALIRIIRTRRRFAAIRAGRDAGVNAWRELSDAVSDLGIVGRTEVEALRAQTPEALVERLAERSALGGAPLDHAQDIVAAYGAERWGSGARAGGTGGGVHLRVSHVRAVTEALFSNAPRGTWLRARFLPRSLVRRSRW
ncbi:MAG: transglutaminaseTgpA domain-containing protein [bacterium]|nr:transglutaminaseTgpA domain-containing protein [bacterium]